MIHGRRVTRTPSMSRKMTRIISAWQSSVTKGHTEKVCGGSTTTQSTTSLSLDGPWDLEFCPKVVRKDLASILEARMQARLLKPVARAAWPNPRFAASGHCLRTQHF